MLKKFKRYTAISLLTFLTVSNLTQVTTYANRIPVIPPLGIPGQDEKDDSFSGIIKQREMDKLYSEFSESHYKKYILNVLKNGDPNKEISFKYSDPLSEKNKRDLFELIRFSNGDSPEKIRILRDKYNEDLNEEKLIKKEMEKDENGKVPDDFEPEVVDITNTAEVGDRVINQTRLQEIFDKYSSKYLNSRDIFKKWETSLFPSDGNPDASAFLLSMKDKYSLQSDIALIESSALFSVTSANTIHSINKTNDTYKTVISPIVDMLATVGGGGGGSNGKIDKLHMNEVKLKFKDSDMDGKYNLEEPLDSSFSVTHSIYMMAMLGNNLGSLPSEDGVEENLTAAIEFPGVFHKGIKTLFSDAEIDTNPLAKAAYAELEKYEKSPAGLNLYYTPYTILNTSEYVGKGLVDLGDNNSDPSKLYIQESAETDHLFSSRIMLQYLITFPSELSQLADRPEVVKSWLTENQERYFQNMELYRDLIELYKAAGLNSLASNLAMHANEQESIMKNLLQANGLSVTDVEEVTQEVEDRNKIFQNQKYYELLAWTSAFTPFETDLTDYEYLMAHVSDGARNIYEDDGLGRKRTPLMAVDRKTQVMTEVQAGNNIGLTNITLRQFIKQVETGDVMLFAQAISHEELLAVNSAKIYERPTDNAREENSGNMGTGVEKETVVSYNEVTASTTSTQFLGPVYFSTSDTNYGVKSKNKKYLKEAGKTSQELLEESMAVAQGYEFEKFATEIKPSVELSQHLTETHGYLNYMLMHNSLENGGSKSTRVQEDLDKGLFIDFLGNIVSHTGIVIVPAFANTTYFQDIEQYNLSHAMFLNSYPTISSIGSSQIDLIKGDEEKLLVGLYPTKEKATTNNNGKIFGWGDDEEGALESGKSNSKWNWRIMGLDKKGKFTRNLNIRRPNNVIYKSMEPVDDLKLRKIDDAKIEFFNPVTGIVDVGLSYAKKDPNEVKESAKVFSFTEFDELTLVGDDFRSRVALNGVSTDSFSGDWLAMKNLNLNHLLDEDYGLNVMSLNYMGHLYSVLNKCTDDVHSMSKNIVLDDYVEKLKDDGIINIFASIFESINNFFMKFVKSNLLVYTPSLDNMTLFKDMSSWITPVGIIFIILALTIGLIYLILSFMRYEGVEAGKIFYIFLVVPSIIFYTVNLHPTVIKYVFQDIPSMFIKNEAFIAIADETESQYKTVNEYLFNDKELIRESDINFKLQSLTQSDALEVRRYADENLGYTESAMYSPKYDHSVVNVFEDKVYLRGLNYYMDVYKLFEMSEVVDILNHDYTYRMEHETNYGYDMIAPKTPFYHIMDTLTYTINTFTEGTSVAMRTIDYGHFTMSTGRSRSFFNSIFFIAPDKFNEFLLAYDEQQNKNLEELETNDLYEDLTPEEIIEYYEEVDGMTPMVQKAMIYMMEKLGDLDDWLGINKILVRSPRLAPFDPEFIPLIQTNDWYPDIISMGDDLVDKKVKKINDTTKNFVLKELVPVLGYMSDETAIKTVALFASMEFSKEFSRDGYKIMPRNLEAVSMSNHFISRTIYMPTVDLFSSSSNSLSYYLANEGIGTLLIAMIDVALRYIVYMIPLLAILLLNFLPIAVIILFPQRHSELFDKVVSLTKITMLLALTRYPMVLGYKICSKASDSMGTVGGVASSIVISVLMLGLLKVLVEVFLTNVVNTAGHIGENLKESFSELNNSILGSKEQTYDNYQSRIYGTDIERNINLNSGDYSYYSNSNQQDQYSSNVEYNRHTNSYESVGGSTSNYSNYNTDGTGWRDESTTIINNTDYQEDKNYSGYMGVKSNNDIYPTDEGFNLLGNYDDRNTTNIYEEKYSSIIDSEGQSMRGFGGASDDLDSQNQMNIRHTDSLSEPEERNQMAQDLDFFFGDDSDIDV